jgi:glycerol kinase
VTRIWLVAPATGGTAKFEIKKTGSSVLIHATSGVLNVSAPGNTFTLAEGATATLDSGTGTSKITSQNRTTAGVYGAQSTTSFFNLEGAIADPSGANVPWCSNTLWCVRPASVSGHKPCRCRKL